MLEVLTRLPITAERLAENTRGDAVLLIVYDAVQSRNVRNLREDVFEAFKSKDTELATTPRGCLTWGSRVVIPTALQPEFSALAHSGHRGTVAMKACAESYMGRPGMAKGIVACVAECAQCQTNWKTKLEAPVTNWVRPSTAWDTIPMDFPGRAKGRVCLVVSDAYAKWLEAGVVDSTSSSAVIEELRNLLATFEVCFYIGAA